MRPAKERQFQPRYVCFDGWYASLENRKAVCGYSWHFLTRLKHNRQVNPDDTKNVAIEDVDIPAQGRRVHLKGFGFIEVFRIVASKGDTEPNKDTEPKIEYWATSDLTMTEMARSDLARQVFAIENYHRQLEQCCGVERAQVRSAKAQKCHILLSLRAFVRLEAHRLQTGIGGYAAKTSIIREAIRLYLQQPTIRLEATA